MRRSVVGVFVLLLALVSCSKPQPVAPSTIVLLVRHAEKASDAEDSPLTEAGAGRGQALVRVAEGAGVSAIYSTQFRRNRDTAQPISDRLKLAVTELPIPDLQNPGDYGKTLARTLLEKHAGQTVLVVGHSNTVPLVLEALTGQPAPVDHAEYSDLFIVTVPPSGAARLIKAQYGAGGAKQRAESQARAVVNRGRGVASFEGVKARGKEEVGCSLRARLRPGCCGGWARRSRTSG